MRKRIKNFLKKYKTSIKSESKFSKIQKTFLKNQSKYQSIIFNEMVCDNIFILYKFLFICCFFLRKIFQMILIGGQNILHQKIN